ncbi:MAG: alpha/beta hydrolase [Chloroflexi bacterium]|nr:alpha/beta hydrolase [Chloroflexota bacterium]
MYNNKLMRRLYYASVLLLTFLASCSTSNLPADPEPSLALEDCVLTSPVGRQVDAQCGTLTVPEDRANSGGRQIDLHIAVIPAISRSPEADPVFLLAGGPGQAATEAFPATFSLLFNLHQDRDIVLVDQRGTGKSNPLRCIDPEVEVLTDEEALAILKDCPNSLDADVRFYTTEIAMTDLDEVRAALGYETINLYGASYGTRAALTYLRMYPQHFRTVTLDSVVDPSFVMFMDAAEDGQAALDQFFARCEADEECAQTFPNLRSEFEGLVARLAESPAEIVIPHPLTNKPTDVEVTDTFITSMVFNILYVPDLVAALPLGIHQAYAEENYIPLISQAFMVNAGLYDGMFYAVTCTEDAPLIDADEAAQKSGNSVFSDRTVDFAAVCKSWQKGQVSPQFREPVVSDVPVLILSGEADPITPPHHAEKVAESLSNDLHLIFAGMGHGNMTSVCGSNIFTAFVESGTLSGLETDCVDKVSPPPFFVNFSGPRP